MFYILHQQNSNSLFSMWLSKQQVMLFFFKNSFQKLLPDCMLTKQTIAYYHLFVLLQKSAKARERELVPTRETSPFARSYVSRQHMNLKVLVAIFIQMWWCSFLSLLGNIPSGIKLPWKQGKAYGECSNFISIASKKYSMTRNLQVKGGFIWFKTSGYGPSLQGVKGGM